MIKDLKYAFEDILKERGVPIEVILEALEAALVSAYKKDHGKEIFPKFILSPNGRDVEVRVLKEVVETVEDPDIEISLVEARMIKPEVGLHEMVETDGSHIDFSFGRIAAQSAKQVVMQRIKEAERGIIFEEYLNRVGQLITGKVRRREKGNIVIELDKHEGIMPPQEQVDGERYIPKTTVKAIIKEVSQTPKGPKIILSRAHPDFVKRLFELEVPEIADGTVEVKRIAREVGSRTKMAVMSHSPDVDPVGACVGSKGSRVQAVVNELKGENIDIIHYTDDSFDFIANALAPARVYSVEIFDEEGSAEVIVPDDQVSLAIGKQGQNVRLAAKLTGWHIDIRKESDKFEMELRAVEEDRQAAIREILDSSVSVLPLRKTALEALEGAGVASIQDVLELGPDGLLTVKGFGEQALKNVQTYLTREGITFEDWRELIGEGDSANKPEERPRAMKASKPRRRPPAAKPPILRGNETQSYGIVGTSNEDSNEAEPPPELEAISEAVDAVQTENPSGEPPESVPGDKEDTIQSVDSSGETSEGVPGDKENTEG